MLKELYTAAMGMLPQQTRLEVIANNMANAATTGFKRQNVFERNLIDAKANLFNVPGDCEQNDPPIGSYTDFNAGSMMQTGNPLDIAIEDNGFFVLQDELGNSYFTRSGHFNLTTDGTIRAMDGKMLMGAEGALNILQEFAEKPLITEDSKAVNIKITPTGDVFANDYRVGTVLIADVNDPQSFQRVSAQNYIAGEDTSVSYKMPADTRIRQGWLEGSNVDIIKEMVTMIELQRQFEAGSKVIHTNEATLDNAIRMGRYY